MLIFQLFFILAAASQSLDPEGRCFYGVYTRQDIPGGSTETTISVVEKDASTNLAFIFYMFFDIPFLGKAGSDGEPIYYCDLSTVGEQVCEGKLGTFLYPEPPTEMRPGQLYPSGSFGVYPVPGTNSTSNAVDFTFTPTKEGLYCYMSNQYLYNVSISPTYGKLDGFTYPLLPFTGVLTLAYLVAAIIWGILSALYWTDILPIQNYIGALYVALMIDNAFRYGYYSYANKFGYSSTGLLAVTAIINALRNAFTFFVLLIVSLGYGVVKPSLGPDMKKCIILGVVLFFSFLLFAIGVDLKSAGNSNMLQLLFIVPISFSMTVAFYWTINALSETIEHLTLRRQNFKLGMFFWLKRILMVMILVFVLGIFVSGSLTSMSNNPRWFASHWYSYWFYRTGWMNVLFFFCFVGISLLWRPTKNNARYGLEELSEFDNAADNNYDMEMNETMNAFKDVRNAANASEPRNESSSGRYNVANGKERAVMQVFNIGSDDDE